MNHLLRTAAKGVGSKLSRDPLHCPKGKLLEHGEDDQPTNTYGRTAIAQAAGRTELAGERL